MIDSKLQTEIERRARQCFEEIHSDWIAGTEDGIGHVSDAVEPTMWQIAACAPEGSQGKLVREMADNYKHPDREQFIAIVTKAVSAYFVSADS